MTTLIPKYELYGTSTNRSISQKFSETVSVKDFGAVGDGVADDTAAIVSAIAASNHVYFPAGTYLVSSTITLTNANNGLVLYGDGSTSCPTAVIYTKTITGYLFSFITYSSGSAHNVEGFTLRGIAIDGTNGNGGLTSIGTSVSNLSSTWQGVLVNSTGTTTSTGFVSGVTIKDCYVCGSNTVTPMFDLRAFYDVNIENSKLWYQPNGYLIYVATPNTDTTITMRKVYMLFCQEAVTVLNGATDVQLYDCIFDSLLVATCIFLTKTLFSGCYFENIGYDVTGGNRKVGITNKQMNVTVSGLNHPVCSAINVDYAPVLFQSCFFNYIVGNTNVGPNNTTQAWLWAMSVGSGVYSNVDVTFQSCFLGNTPLIETGTDATAAQNSGLPPYIAWYEASTTVGASSNGLLYADIRALQGGRLNVTFPSSGGNPTYNQIVDIVNGRFIVTASHQFSGAPTNSPTSGQWNVGDTVYVLTPTAGGNIGYVCTTAGTPGTWKTFGAIAA